MRWLLSVRGEARPASSSDTILSAIERLESAHDAKCHSTASRFEDFLFGTPLSDAARIAHEEAKRRVALGLWSAASRRAREAGDATLERRHIDREATELAVTTQQQDGRIRVELVDGAAVELETEPGAQLREIEIVGSVQQAVFVLQRNDPRKTVLGRDAQKLCTAPAGFVGQADTTYLAFVHQFPEVFQG